MTLYTRACGRLCAAMAVAALVCACPHNQPPDDTPRAALFDAAALARLRDARATSRAYMYAPIKTFADKVKNGTASEVAALPPAQPPAGATQNFFRTEGNALVGLALVAIMEDSDEWYSLAKKHLLTISAWTTWDTPRNDLGQIHLLIGSSLAYSWLKATCDAAEKQTVEAALGRWAQLRYRNAVEAYDNSWNNWWPQSYAQNHCASNYAALGLAALALDGVDPRAPQWLDTAVTHWKKISALLDTIVDGTWHEGFTYQLYQFQTAIPFLYALKGKKDIDLIPRAYWKAFLDYAAHSYMPGSHQWAAPWGDVADEPWRDGAGGAAAVFSILAAEYRDGRGRWLSDNYAAQSNGRWADVWAQPYASYEFLFADTSLAPEKPSGATSLTLKDAEAVLWRSSWDDDAIVFGLKAGAYGGRSAYEAFHARRAPFDGAQPEINAGHDHRDAGGFWLSRGGSWLIPEDLMYTGTDSSLHNTLLVNGQGQAPYSPGSASHAVTASARYDARLADSAEDSAHNYLEADLSRAYAHIADVEKVSRYVIYIRPDLFLIIDELRSTNTATQWTALFHALTSIQKETTGGRTMFTCVNGTHTAAVQTLHPTSAAIHITSSSGKNIPQAEIQTQGNSAAFVHLISMDGAAHAQLLERNDGGLRVKILTLGGAWITITLNTSGTGAAPASPCTLAGEAFARRLRVIHYDASNTEQRRFEH